MPPLSVQINYKPRISSTARILEEKSFDFFIGICEAKVSLDYSDTASPHDVSRCAMGRKPLTNKRHPRFNATVGALAKNIRY